MSRSLKTLGGKDWDRLGLASPDDQDLPWVPSWESLVPLLAEAGPTALHGERMGLIYLDALDDAGRSVEQLCSVDPGQAGANWLLLQLALQQRSEELLETWCQREGGAVERAMASVIQVLLHGGSGSSEPWGAEGDVFCIGRMLVLGRQGAWEDLAAQAGQEPTISRQLFAAAIWGILGQPARQREVLEQVSEESLLAAETLVDLALSGEGTTASALIRRAAALAAYEDLIAEACATQVMSMLRDDGSVLPRPVLNPKHAASAWWHLDALLDRASGAEDHLVGLPVFQATEECPTAK